MIKKIVLTGGPCAGKTTALAKIEEDLNNMGYKVLMVGESATELIKSGVRPFGEKPMNLVDFQKIIMLYQYQKEEVYREVLKKYKLDNVVILYDRGLMDNRAYITDKEFKEVLNYISNRLGTEVCEEDILERYDMVIHLVTAADGKQDSYTILNNQARTEGIDEAIGLDKRTMNAWINHPNLKIIDNEEEFSLKIDKVLEQIHRLLNQPVRIRKQLKYLIDIEPYFLEFIKNHSVMVDIEQVYLKSDFFEERIRKLTKEGVCTYYYTKQKKEEDGISQVILHKKISKEEYNMIKNMSDMEDIIFKRRYSFILNKQYYRLDEYEDCYVLELEVTDENKEVNIPNGISIKKNYSKRKRVIKV